MKYIDSEELIAEIERLSAEHSSRYGMDEDAIVLDKLEDFIASLQQEQPEGNLEYWLEHFGMPKENIDYCITQIAQGYGACRYLEGVQHGAEAVNELAPQEQPEVDLEKEIQSFWNANALEYRLGHVADIIFLAYTARHFYELGQRAKYQQDREEFAKLKAKEWQEGYDEGYAKWLARKEE